MIYLFCRKKKVSYFRQTDRGAFHNLKEQRISKHPKEEEKGGPEKSIARTKVLRQELACYQ